MDSNYYTICLQLISDRIDLSRILHESLSKEIYIYDVKNEKVGLP